MSEYRGLEDDTLFKTKWADLKDFSIAPKRLHRWPDIQHSAYGHGPTHH